MTSPLDELEDRMARLRAALRHAVRAGAHGDTERLGRALHQAEREWADRLAYEAERTLAPPPRHPPPAAAPVREQVRQVLTVLGAPAGAKLVATASEALFARPLTAARLASLRRDEHRSFLATGGERPYYICAALVEDGFRPARGLLALSTWPLERRITGPHSPRADALLHTAGIARHLRDLQRQPTACGGVVSWPPHAVRWLLRRLTPTVLGALTPDGGLDPDHVLRAVHTETAKLRTTGTSRRSAVADRVRRQLTPAEQLFGTRAAR